MVNTDIATQVVNFESIPTASPWYRTGTDVVASNGRLAMPGMGSDWVLGDGPGWWTRTATPWAMSSSWTVFKLEPASSTVRPVIGFLNSYQYYHGLVLWQSSDSVVEVSRLVNSTITATELSATTTDRWWRVRYVSASTTFVFERSANCTSWTTVGSVNITNLGTANIDYSSFWLGIYNHTSGASAEIVDGINVNTIRAVEATASNLAPAPTFQIKNTISPPVATASNLAPAPTPNIWKTVYATVATVAVQAPAPTLVESIAVPAASMVGQAWAPGVLAPLPRILSPPVATAEGHFEWPSDVIAPPPNTQAPHVATVSVRAPAPLIEIRDNTVVYAARSSASIEMLPPGEYVRITPPAAVSSASAFTSRRAGPVLSDFAATVVQTPQNWGGACVYYRLSDASDTLIDVLGVHYGSWSGTHNLVTGSVVNDPDQATEFDGTGTTQAGVGDLQVLGGGGGDPRGAMIAFRVLEDASEQQYIWARAWDASLNWDYRGRMEANGFLTIQFREGNDTHSIGSTHAINDGEWHFVVVTVGRPMDDDSGYGTQGNLRFYLDGQIQGYLNAGAEPWNDPLVLGTIYPGSTTSAALEGALDEYAEFPYAPSRWEVKELHNQWTGTGGPPLRLEPPLVEVTGGRMPAPQIRKAAIHPLNSFSDDFNLPSIDLSKWRDSTPNVTVSGGAAILPANSAKILTQDYYQCKDGSITFRLDRLPIREGHVFLGLVNEYDGPWEPFRTHRHIGFDFIRYQYQGQTRTELTFVVAGEEEHGAGQYTRTIDYVPDAPAEVSPMRYLRLDIDPGISGGAHWYTSRDGMLWTLRYEVVGDSVQAYSSWEMGDNGVMVKQTHYKYEEAGAFRLFHEDALHEVETRWRGYMRVQVSTDQGNSATNAVLQSVNIFPVGQGTPANVLAKTALIQTNATQEFLDYVLQPRRYSSAMDVQIEVPLVGVYAQFLTPPEPVRVAVSPATAEMEGVPPQRAGDALPVSLEALAGTVAAAATPPTHAGEAQPVHVLAVPGSVTGDMYDIEEVVTDISSPALPPGRVSRNVFLRTRKVRVLVTQN